MDIKRIKPSDKDKLRKLLYDFHINNRIKTFSKGLQELEKYKDNNQTIDKSVDDYLNDSKYIIYIAEENDEPLGFIAGNVVEKPQKVLDKIFQPFFTTKPTGHGTGLGLSLAYDILKAHQGDLSVTSEEGKGTTFFIRIPITS
jgi:signal transduction histidine kinase